jgi:hypothetical protein
MFKNWFSQGLATNMVSWVIIAVTGLVVAYIAKVVPLWVAPILYGLTASALAAIIIIGIRFTFRPSRRIISPNNARVSVRECLDQAQLTIQNAPLDGWIFNYNITVDGRNMAVGQQRREPNYLTFSTAITFTPGDNVAIESRQGGVAAVVKALRIT